jgi:hypothetical protein
MPSERKTRNNTTREQQTGTAISGLQECRQATAAPPATKGFPKKSAPPAPDARACWQRVSSDSGNPAAIRRHFGTHAIHTHLAADQHPHHRPPAGKGRQTTSGRTVARQGTDREPSGFPHPMTRLAFATIRYFSREKGPLSGICVRCKRLDCRHEGGPPLLFFSAISSLLFSPKRDEKEEEGPPCSWRKTGPAGDCQPVLRRVH